MKKALILAGLLLAFAIPTASAATIYTGDRLDGVAVIDKLDLADLPAGKITKLWFRVSDQAIGQGWYVPVIVVKGAKDGPKLMLTAGVHGDELNGIAVAHHVVKDIDPKSLTGTVVVVAGANTPGLLHSSRQFTPDGLSSAGENLNRIMPGDMRGNSADIFAARLWSNIIMGNTDIAIDLHTQSRGAIYPMYIFAETAKARHLADVIAPDVINMDAGVMGTVENTLNASGFTAVTLELGAPENFDPVVIARGVAGIFNVLKDQGMVAGKPVKGPTPFVGNTVVNVETPRGGFAHIAVKLGDKVKAGAKLAIVIDSFGDVIATLTAPHDGQVLSLATDPRRNPGDMVVRLIWWDDKGVCAHNGCPSKAPIP